MVTVWVSDRRRRSPGDVNVRTRMKTIKWNLAAEEIRSLIWAAGNINQTGNDVTAVQEAVSVTARCDYPANNDTQRDASNGMLLASRFS